MNDKHDERTGAIEARLDRSLAHQIPVPRLDRRFDAAVWARIEREESPLVRSGPDLDLARPSRASRWLAVSNAVGAGVALLLMAYFAMQMFGGIEVPAGLTADVPVPQMSDALLSKALSVFGQVLGVAVLVFVLGLTSLGRRLRASFS